MAFNFGAPNPAPAPGGFGAPNSAPAPGGFGAPTPGASTFKSLLDAYGSLKRSRLTLFY